jgi:hypothetical protein
VRPSESVQGKRITLFGCAVNLGLQYLNGSSMLILFCEEFCQGQRSGKRFDRFWSLLQKDFVFLSGSLLVPEVL